MVQDSELGAGGRPDHRVRFATVALAGPVEQAAGIPAATGGSRPRQSSEYSRLKDTYNYLNEQVERLDDTNKDFIIILGHRIK